MDGVAFPPAHRVVVQLLAVGEQTVGLGKSAVAQVAADRPRRLDHRDASLDVLILPIMNEISRHEGRFSNVEQKRDGIDLSKRKTP